MKLVGIVFAALLLAGSLSSCASVDNKTPNHFSSGTRNTAVGNFPTQSSQAATNAGVAISSVNF